MVRGLHGFGRSAGDNVGRTNLVELGGVRLLIDYAHNPHGMAALAQAVAGLPAARRLVLIGQAGDRPDEALRALARAALALRPDRVVLKEMERYLRGRQPGEIPAIMADELARLGVPPAAVTRPGTEAGGGAGRAALGPSRRPAGPHGAPGPAAGDGADRAVAGDGWRAGEPTPE